MRKASRAVLLLLALLFVMANTSCDSSLTLINQSSYEIIDVRLSPVGALSWGRNLLGGGTLLPGESLTVDFIDCDTYDVRITDDTGAECILNSLSLCFDAADWVIDDAYLATCGF
jgi:hypothetical protein